MLGVDLGPLAGGRFGRRSAAGVSGSASVRSGSASAARLRAACGSARLGLRLRARLGRRLGGGRLGAGASAAPAGASPRRLAAGASARGVVTGSAGVVAGASADGSPSGAMTRVASSAGAGSPGVPPPLGMTLCQNRRRSGAVSGWIVGAGVGIAASTSIASCPAGAAGAGRSVTEAPQFAQKRAALLNSSPQFGHVPPIPGSNTSASGRGEASAVSSAWASASRPEIRWTFVVRTVACAATSPPPLRCTS